MSSPIKAHVLTAMFTCLNGRVRTQLIAVALTIPFVLTACSSQSDSSPSMTPMVTESVSPQASASSSDSCAVLDQMQSSLSTAVTDLIANPDLVTAFEKEFDNQVGLLDDLVASMQGDSGEAQQLQTDLDTAVLAKDEALNTFNDAQQADNAFSKVLGMADAARSASDAMSAAEQVLVDLSAQLQCTQ